MTEVGSAPVSAARVMAGEMWASSGISEAQGAATPWRAAITAIPVLARRVGVTPTRVKLLLPLAHLSPALTRAVLAGTLPPSITLTDIYAAAERLDWTRQAESLGVAPARQSRVRVSQR